MGITQKMHEDVLNWTLDTLAALGVTDLPVDVEWNDRFTRRLGDARYKPDCSRVRFSAPLWPRASEKERYETVVHEVCHIVAYHQNRGRRIEPHGWEWQCLMIKCGVEPERCHNVDRTGLARTRKTASAWCNCMEHKITPQMAGRIRFGETRRICKRCRGILQLSPPTAHASAAADSVPNESRRSLEDALGIRRSGNRAFMNFI